MNNQYAIRDTRYEIPATPADSKNEQQTTRYEIRTEVTQIDIGSQNAAKLFFFSFPAETAEKIRNSDSLFYETNPILPTVALAKVGSTTYPVRDYENKHNWTLGKNKPKQTQFKPNLPNAQNERKLCFKKGL